MEGFWSILYKFGDGIYIIPHELTEGLLFTPYRFDEKVIIIPSEIDGGIGFDGGVLIYSPPPNKKKRGRDSHSFAII